MLLVELFRRSRRYVERKEKISQVLENAANQKFKWTKNPLALNKEVYIEKNKLQKRFRFPWWVKIIAFILSHSLMVVSGTFVIIKGIEFGDQTVGKWLTSLVVAFLSSALLTQPLKVSRRNYNTKSICFMKL